MAGGVDWGCSLGCSEHSTHVWRQSAHHRRPCIKRGGWPRPEPESCTSRRTAGSARAASMTCTGAVHCMQATIGPTAATARNGAQREKEKEREKVRVCVCVFVRGKRAGAGPRAAAPVPRRPWGLFRWPLRTWRGRHTHIHTHDGTPPASTQSQRRRQTQLADDARAAAVSARFVSIAAGLGRLASLRLDDQVHRSLLADGAFRVCESGTGSRPAPGERKQAVPARSVAFAPSRQPPWGAVLGA